MTVEKIGYCITPHGFGHAARAAAVMEALAARMDAEFHLVTSVPEWFFRQSLSCSFILHRVESDVGLVQHSALEEDMEASLAALASLYPFSAEVLDPLCELLAGCSLIICDIAPVGIAVAKRCGSTSVLIENFTWDWIYEGYVDSWPALRPYITYLEQLFVQADHRIQTAPVCRPMECDCRTAPVARRARTARRFIREQLGVEDGVDMVLVTMGGVCSRDLQLQPLTRLPETVFVLPGYADTLVRDGNLRLLPANSGIYHPDLIQASDVVIGKVGYSTLAEVHQAGVPFGYVCRRNFRESGPLAAFIRQHMPSVELEAADLASGKWLDYLVRLRDMPHRTPIQPNGADEVAEFLVGLYGPATGKS